MDEWTSGRKHGFIVNTLRWGSRKWPAKFKTLEDAKTEKKINPSSGRLAQFYLCNRCKKEYTNKDVEVDHIIPVVDPKVGFVDWNTFIDRMFCERSNYQVLCKPCHKKKTKEESGQGQKVSK